MSRDARKVLDNLTKLTSREYAASDVFVAEQLCTKYFPNIINNIVKQIYKKSTSTDRDNMWYYSQPVLSMNKQPRADDMWTLSDRDKDIYLMVSYYLLDDFTNDHIPMLREICTFGPDDVRDAIRIGKQEDVFSIPYIYRILEGVRARRDYKINQMDQRRGMFVGHSDGGRVNVHGVLELASFAYQWQQAIENIELKRRVDDLRREER